MNEKKEETLKVRHFVFIIIFIGAICFIINYFATKNDFEDKDMTKAFFKTNEKGLEKIKRINIVKDLGMINIEINSKFKDLESEINDSYFLKKYISNTCQDYLDFKIENNSLIMDIDNVKQYGKEKVYLDINECFDFIVNIVDLAEKEKSRQNNNINETFKEPSNEK